MENLFWILAALLAYHVWIWIQIKGQGIQHDKFGDELDEHNTWIWDQDERVRNLERRLYAAEIKE